MNEAAAIITIRHADLMTKSARKQVADWMRKQASLLEKEGDNFSSRFTGRYFYKARRTKCA